MQMVKSLKSLNTLKKNKVRLKKSIDINQSFLRLEPGLE